MTLVAVILGGATLVAAPASAAPGCQVTYTVQNQWTGGFVTEVKITNTGDALSGWTLAFTFPDAAQRLTQGWSATWSQTGQAVTATNLNWNGAVATGGSTNIGFQGTFGAQNPKPTDFRVNGTPCGGAGTAPTATITSPANGATLVAGSQIPVSATAADADGTVSKVDFYAGDTLIGTDTSSPYSTTWNAPVAGSYVLVARATDNAGNVGASAPVDVTVSANTSPRVIVEPLAIDVPEGQSRTVQVHLSQAPSATVTATASRVDGDTSLTVGGNGQVTFTTQNWGANQLVTINAAQDADNTNGVANFQVTASGFTAGTFKATEIDDEQTQSTQRFLELYQKIKAPSSGYFSSHTPPIPYHAVETLIVEAPDYGHVTTSEAYSYWLMLEAAYGRVTSDWTRFNEAWTSMETHLIPTAADQPATSGYNPNDPATYAPEFDLPNQYPSPLDNNIAVGQDPLANELSSTYGNNQVYGMHWLLDVDNRYGYGRRGDGTSSPSYINTFQRGPQESVWETVPHPSWESFNDGGPNGFLDLFTGDQQYATQWRYTNAPDADARAVQAAYWANQWATAQGNGSAVSATVDKASKMGDYLRYAMYDKYFKRQGNCVGPSTCPAGSGKNSSAYLLSWYYAWGGATNGSWAWRIGSSYNHFGYQNPMAAYALSSVAALQPNGPTAVTDWTTSLQRQLEFYRWLQSSEGAIAGGATNSWAGRYATPPSGTSTFYGMFYDEQPVYHDPPSNRWFGMQVWSMQRLAEFYDTTTNATQKALAKTVLDKWVAWALSETTVNAAAGTWSIPSEMDWTGQPDTWNAGSPGANNGLHVDVTSYGTDLGVTGAYARTLLAYAAESGNTAARTAADNLLNAMWTHSDAIGISVPETRADYARFDDSVYVPSGWTGTMANGDPINSSSTFMSLRSWYEQDPQWSKIEALLNNGTTPTFEYHRFWAQTDIALALADQARLFGT